MESYISKTLCQTLTVNEHIFSSVISMQDLVWYTTGILTNRENRLIECSCVRYLHKHLPESCHGALVCSEQFADGMTTRKALRKAHQRVEYIKLHKRDYALARQCIALASLEHACIAKMSGAGPFGWVELCETFWILPQGNRNYVPGIEDDLTPEFLAEARKAAWQSILDVTGNPFELVKLDPQMTFDADTVELARAWYESADPSQLHQLNRVLTERDPNSEIARHFSSDFRHVKGCWAIDWILGRRRNYEKYFVQR
jgi:hypothetical protein